MKQKESPMAEEILREFKRISMARGTTEAHWQEIAERVIPSHSQTFQMTAAFNSKGAKKTQNQVDSTAAVALNRFAAIMDSLLTPRNQTWHRIIASDPHLNKDRQTRLWFEEANRILFKYRYAPKANFASQNQHVYKSLGAYGTGCMFIDKLDSDVGFRYKNIHLGEIYFVENHQGIIDKAYRHFAYSARQALQEWGSACPERVMTAYKINPEQIFFFIHCVRPRHDVDPGRLDYKGMPIASYYVSMENQSVVKEEGFRTFPYAISRYEQAPGEVYGRSPAMDVLPAIKTLNEQKKAVLKQGHRIVDPILLVHDDGIMDSFSLKPGSSVAGGVSADGRPLVHTLPTGNLAVGKDLMDDERQLINDAFLVTLFQILVDSPQMTATEVMERSREKGILIAPTIGRQYSEYLGPNIERELDLGTNMGLFPPMPPLLLEAQGEYRIEYDSPLSRAQRAEEASGLMRTIETVLNVVNITQNPEPLDHFDFDIIVPELSEIHGVPARWTKDMKAVLAVREGRQKQTETQEIIQGAPAAAAMMKAAGPTGR